MIYTSIPNGYRAVPLESDLGSFSWSISLLVRAGAAGKNELVMLANLPDSRAYLGCLADRENKVREWVQIWVQDLEGLLDIDQGLAEQLTGEQLDRRWRRHWQATKNLSPSQIIAETAVENLRPFYLDAQQLKVVCPKTAEGTEWRVCRNDAELEQAKLPKSSQSIWRYLAVGDAAKGTAMYCSTDKRAPVGGLAQERSAALGFKPELIPINPQGGQVAVRVHPPLDFGDYADLIGGATIAEIGARKRDCEAAILASTLGVLGQDGRRHGLMLGNNNAAELFYLRLRLVLQAGKALLANLRGNQCPLLNLDPCSFGIGIQATGELPWAWTTTCELVRPGRAVTFAIPNTDQVRFIAAGDTGIPAYCPSTASRRGDMGVTIRPLRINVEDRRVSIEGSIWVSSPFPVETSDIVRFRLTQAGIAGEFFAAVVLDKPGLLQEIKFRTWNRDMTPEEIAQLRRFEGGKLERSWCEFIPVLSSPYDFYSFSLVGARALLVNPTNLVSGVIDELERLGRVAGNQLPAGASLPQVVDAVEKILAAEKGNEILSAVQIFGQLPNRPKQVDFLPPRMWAETIALLVRLMPGLGNASVCADYGAAPSGGLHVPLEETIAALENLCARARSLVISDWNSNRELRSLLAEIKSSI